MRKTHFNSTIGAALLGLALASSSSMAQNTNLIAEMNFDQYTFGGSWGYTYAGGNAGNPAGGTIIHTTANNAPIGVEVNGTPSQAFFTDGDFTGLLTDANWTNSTAWTYSGLVGECRWDAGTFLNVASITTTNPAAYMFESDMRVYGQPTVAPIKIRIRFEAPDDSIFFGLDENGIPKFDADTNPDLLLETEYIADLGSNWLHVAATFDDMTIRGGSMATLFEYYYYISGMNVMVIADPATVPFGLDAGNGIVMDNVRLYSMYTPPPPPKATFTILEWNMDDKPLNGDCWGGQSWSALGAAALPSYSFSTNAAQMAGFGKDGGNGWWLLMDNTTLAPPNNPQWAGGQTGGEGPANLGLFTDNILKNYYFECDARVEGMSNGIAADATTTVNLQFFLDSPNGNVRLDFNVPAGSNWVRSSLDFNSASWDTGDGRLPKASFATNYNTYTATRMQWQINSANSGTTWDFDANNRLVVDNLKVIHKVIGCPPLKVFTQTNNVIVTWQQPETGAAVLLTGNTLGGVTNEAAGASSPYIVPVATAPKYFRTKWIAPE